MTLRALTALFGSILSIGSCNPNTGPGPYVLVWEDEFVGAAGTMPNAANWKYDIGTDWGNAQLEYDTDRP